MGLPNPMASAGKLSSGAGWKVLSWLFVIAGCVRTVQEAWNGQNWFVLTFLDWAWMWITKGMAAVRT